MKVLISFLTLLLLAASCQSDDSYLGTAPEIIFTENTPREKTIYAEDTDSAYVIEFQTNYTWRVDVYDVTSRNIENNTDWVYVSQYGGGRGRHTLEINTKVNETGCDRQAEIVITCGDKTTFTLTQKGTKKPVQKMPGA